MTNDRYLFRGFHKYENGNETIYIDGQASKGKWVYGDLAHSIYKKDNKLFISTYQDYILDDYDATMFEVIPETVCEYTGLKDKNGVEIYENDILQLFDTINESREKVIIRWNSESASYEVLQLNENHYSFDVRPAINPCEVIGNIYDKEV